MPDKSDEWPDAFDLQPPIQSATSIGRPKGRCEGCGNSPRVLTRIESGQHICQTCLREIRGSLRTRYSPDHLAKMYRMYAAMKGWNTTEPVVRGKVQAWTESGIGPVGLAIEFYETGIDGAPHLDRVPERRDSERPVRVQTVEQTGKNWKATQAGGCLMVIVGIMATVLAANSVSGSHEDSGAGWILLVFFGLVVFLFGRIGAWWNHG